CVRGDIEHYLRAPERSQHSARERLVAVYLPRRRMYDGVVVHVHQPIATNGTQLCDTTCTLTLLHRPGCASRLTNAPIHEPLKPNLGIVVHVCTAHEDVEQRSYVFPMNCFHACCNLLPQGRGKLRDVRVRCGISTGLGNAEQHKFIVIGETYHQPGRRNSRLVQHLLYRGGRCLEHAVELLPAVDFLKLGVPHEAEVDNFELPAVLYRPPTPLDHDWQGGQSRQGVVQGNLT